MSRQDEKKKKKKKRESIIEAEIMAILNKSLNVAVNKALDDIFKGWK